MYDKREEHISFIESTGAYVCKSAELAVRGFAFVIGSAAAAVKRSAAPARKNAAEFLCKVIKAPVVFIGRKTDSINESARRFKRRAGIFGLKKAVSMQYREAMLAFRRNGGAGAVVNVLFPIASVSALVMCVNTVMSTDYGVAVEYDGARVGVVSGEEVLGEAQRVVADRVKYYDTNGDYYVTATLAITPLTTGDDVIDETALAEKMEKRISLKYDEKPVEIPAEEIVPVKAEENSPEAAGMIKAYAVTVNGELIGAVENYSQIENVLEEIKKPYDSGEYSEITFDKAVEYKAEDYVYPEDLVSENEILQTLTGTQSSPEYYEVQPGDNLWKIAESKGMTLNELSGCFATYNGKAVDDLEHSILRVGTLIQIKSETPYLQVECKKEATFRADIPYETITIEDPELPTGQSVVENEGANGEKHSRAIVTYREGVAVRKRTLSTTVVSEPVSKIVRVGTGKPRFQTDVPEFITEGGTGDYFWPVSGGYISAYQGDGRGHKGIDIAAPYGTPIYAASSGYVTKAYNGTGWNGGYGKCVMIANDDGNVTMYAHQSEVATEEDAYVEKGQLIGYVGSTGDSTGNHLHFEVRHDGKYYDPILYVSQD